MKRTAAILLSLVLCAALGLSAFAAEAQNAGTLIQNDLFSFVLRRDFSEVESGQENIIKFAADDGSTDSINIYYLPNTEKQHFADFTDAERAEFAKQLSPAIEKSYADQNIQAKHTVNDIYNLTADSGWTVLVYESETVLNASGETLQLYQKQVQYAGERYIYTVTYTTDDEELLDSADAMLFSLKPAEAEFTGTAGGAAASSVKKGNGIVYGTITGAVVGAALGGIIAIIASVKKKKNGGASAGNAPAYSTSAAPQMPGNTYTDNKE